jgi:YD repeat-containing protein
MKTFVLIALFIFPALGFAKETETTLKKMDLNGPVKSLTYTTYNAKRVNGSIEKTTRAKMDKFERDYAIEFDRHGNKKTYREIDQDGKTTRSMEYEYNDKNNVVSEHATSEKDTLKTVHQFSYKYDDKGNAIEKNWTDGTQLLLKYDSNNNLIDSKYYEHGKLISHRVISYDQKNRDVLNLLYGKDSTLQYKIEKTYDENGNVSEETWHENKDKFRIKYLYTYDAKHNQLTIAWINKRGKQYDHYEFTYEFDQNGNWTRRNETSNNKPLYVFERIMTYY